MSWVLDSSSEEAYRLLVDYLKRRGVAIVRSESPSSIRGVFGSWTELVLDNAKGVVKVTIDEQEKGGGCSVDLGLNFLSEFFVAFVLTVVMATFTFLIYGMPGFSLTWAVSMIVIEVVIIWGIVGYSTRLTRRKFMEEFNAFMQSHSAKKQ